jgi:membrane protease YdiL (CAAX protease family)
MLTYTLTLNLSWHTGDLNTFLPILLSISTFVTYWFISKSDNIKAWFYNKYEFDKASVYHITFNRVIGFLSMGVISGLLCLVFLPEYSLADYGFTYIPGTFLFTILWTIALSVLVIPLAYISAQKPKNLINYPQIRAKLWTRKTILINALGWALYLFGYEFMFRGILLFPLVDHFGVWPAIAINIALYSATHVPKGLEETIGAVPLGLVLCLLTISSGTIWIAFFVHLAMAWTNSFTALKFHPDMKYMKSE